jgi:hypothetical protein
MLTRSVAISLDYYIVFVRMVGELFPNFVLRFELSAFTFGVSRIRDRLCGLVVRVPGHRFRISVSIPALPHFSE